MPDSMTFLARSSGAQCELCSTNLAVFEFTIQCEREDTRQVGTCCANCAHHLLDALAQMTSSRSKPGSPPGDPPSGQPSPSPSPRTHATTTQFASPPPALLR